MREALQRWADHVEQIEWAVQAAELSFEAKSGGAAKYSYEYLEFPKFCERVAEFIRAQGFISDRDVNKKFGRNLRYGPELERVLTQLRKEGRIHRTKQTPANGGHTSEGWGWCDE